MQSFLDGYGWNGKWTSPYFAWGIYLDDNSGSYNVKIEILPDGDK